MLRLTCPVCGERDETEFSYLGDANVERPAMENSEAKAWMSFIFLRDNPRGMHQELWHHVLGCRQCLVVERDTATHEIKSCHLARESGN